MEKRIDRKFVVLSASIMIALALFCVLAILVATKRTFWLDKFNVVLAGNRNKFWTSFFKIFTHLGSIITLAILAIIASIILWFVKKKRMSVFYLVCFGVVAISNFVIKRIVRRPRPEHLMLIKETGFSFPSGHSMMSFVLFALLIHFVYTSIKNKWLKWTIISVCSVLVAAIGFSRIYLGVHFVTDVLAGWLISFSITGVFIILYNTRLFSRLKDANKIDS